MFTGKQTTRDLGRTHRCVAILALSWLLIGVPAAFSQDDPPPDEPDFPPLDAPNPFVEPHLPGTIEGTGTEFAVTDSDYLNVTLQSTEPVQLNLESLPEMIVIHVEAAEGATATQVTLSGLVPSTTYYKYEDDYHNLETLLTDDAGACTYGQDLVAPHLVFIQPLPSTRYIPSDTSIGTWDPDNRVYTLNTNVNETIQIDADNLTLDGAGHTLIGSGTGSGVYLFLRTGVTITDLHVQGFDYGIHLAGGGSNTLVANTALDNDYGIYLRYTSYNTLEDNAATDNSRCGIYLQGADCNTLTQNEALRNSQTGIRCTQGANHNTFTYNIASNNGWGISLGERSTHNTLEDNTTDDNDSGGIAISGVLEGESPYTLHGNTASGNLYGIALGAGTNCQLTGNIMSDNTYNFAINATTNDHFAHDVGPNNTVNGKPILFLNGPDMSTVVVDDADDYGMICIANCDTAHISDQILAPNKNGILLWNVNEVTVERVTAGNSYYGIYVMDSGNTVLANNVTDDNVYGMWIEASGDVIVSDSTANFNWHGITVRDCMSATISDNSATGNRNGIDVSSDSVVAVTGNTCTANDIYGIYLQHCDNGVVAANTIEAVYGGIRLYQDAIGNCISDNVISGNAPELANVGISLSSQCNYNVVSGNNITMGGGSNGIVLAFCYYNTLHGNTIVANHEGVVIYYSSSNNIVSGNTLSGHSAYGALIGSGCSGNTLRENTLSANAYGVCLRECSNNEIYNNSFIENTYAQARVVDCGGNLFNLPAPVGGNYWSNWAPPEHPDAEPEPAGDGFVDEPYVFSGGRDNLPWAIPDGWLNQPPVAEAGDGQPVHPGMLVTLDASDSSDPDEDYPLTYFWQLVATPPGSLAELTDAGTVNPSFVPDMMGDYTIELVVTDSRGLESAPDEVTVSTYNTNPVADAGADQALLVIGSVVELGTDPTRQSYDEDGDDITYLWTMSQKPAGSAAALDFPESPTPTFVADVYGAYEIVLVVTDSFGAESDPTSPLATVTVSFENVQPVAVAGGSPSVYLGETVFLDGSESYDVNQDPLTCSWSIVSRPEGSLVEIDDPTAVQTDFVPDVAGTYVVSLVVNDGLLDSAPSNLNIQVISTQDAVVDILLAAIDAINNLDDDSLKNRNMKKPLVNKINAALAMIDNGQYLQALDKLMTDVLQKMNGCAETGEPDRNDWLITCEAQAQVYPLIVQAIDLLEQLTQ